MMNNIKKCLDELHAAIQGLKAANETKRVLIERLMGDLIGKDYKITQLKRQVKEAKGGKR